MSEPLYPIPCFHTGRIVAEGTLDQLREYFNLLGQGDPFDQDGRMRYPESRIAVQDRPQAAPLKLVLVKG